MPKTKESNIQRLLWIAVIVAIVIGGACVFLFHFDTYHFAVVRQGVLYRMGVRDVRELDNTLNDVHPRTVVCLVTDAEVADPSKGDFKGEFALLKKDGITLDRIRIKPGGWPTPAQIDQFLQIVQDKRNQPVIVHCAQGVERTGMMVAAYQRQVLGYSEKQAIASIEIFGKSEERAEHVTAFIKHYYQQPVASAVAAVKPVGSD